MPKNARILALFDDLDPIRDESRLPLVITLQKKFDVKIRPACWKEDASKALGQVPCMLLVVSSTLVNAP